MSELPKTVDTLTQALRWVLGLLAAAVVVAAAWVAFAYASTPPALRHPAQAHYHFRLQIINDGQPVSFVEDKFQTEFNKDVCTAALTKEPVHFHDQLDQFVHIHWAHLTGAVVLKSYGWNFAGGSSGTLGYRFDQLPKVMRVPIHGHALPPRAPSVHYFVYIGDGTSYQQRNWKDFLYSDLRDFLAGASTTLLERITPSARAASADEEKLNKLNHVLGSVVIFAQANAPSDAQIKDRFSHLVALPQSVCGG